MCEGSVCFRADTSRCYMGRKPELSLKHKITHNKIPIIDRNTLITRSFNFSKVAEETLLILKGNKTRRTDTFRILKRIRGIRRGMQEDNLNKNGRQTFFLRHVFLTGKLYDSIKRCKGDVKNHLKRKKDLQHLAISPCYYWRARPDSNGRPTDS